MERCPTQAVLPLVGLAAEKVIRDRYKKSPHPISAEIRLSEAPTGPPIRPSIVAAQSTKSHQQIQQR
ncbi:MAG: hypothetical protein ACQESR_05425 [Planctomycetota bacterium]